MKKQVALSLAMMLNVGVSGTVFAATDADLEKEISNIRTRIAQLEQSLKSSEAAVKTEKKSKLSYDGSDFRIRWVKNGADGGNNTKFEQRIRLNMNYAINEDITYNGRWYVMNNNELGKTSQSSTTTDGYKVTDSSVSVKKFLGSDIVMTMGRFGQEFGATGYWNSNETGLIDGIKFTGGTDVKVTAGFANFGAFANSLGLEDTWFMNVAYPLNKNTTVHGMWVKETTGSDSNFDVRGLGVSANVLDNIRFMGDYTKNYGMANKPAGYYTSLKWREIKPSQPGSFSVNLDYRRIQRGNMFSEEGTRSAVPLYTYNATMAKSIGFKGGVFGASYVAAPNVVVDGLKTFNTRNADTGANLANYMQLQATVSF